LKTQRTGGEKKTGAQILVWRARSAVKTPGVFTTKKIQELGEIR